MLLLIRVVALRVRNEALLHLAPDIQVRSQTVLQLNKEYTAPSFEKRGHPLDEAAKGLA